MTGHTTAREGRALFVARRFAALLLRCYFRLRVHGMDYLPAQGPVLVAGNHSSFLDGPIVYIVLPRPSAFLVKSEIYVGWLRRVLDIFRQIPIHRGTPDRTALRRGLDVLAAGAVLGMFPEGTRGSGGFDSIQHGIGYLAVKSDCPIVPVACLGTGAALPVGHRLPRWRSRVDVVMGPPVHVRVDGDPRARSTAAAAAEQIRAHLVAHLAAASGETNQPLPDRATA